MQPFLTQDDMIRYVHNSVAMYRDQAVHLQCTGLDLNMVQLVSLSTGDYLRTCSITDPDLNLHTFHLGYINYRGGAHYISRKPVRKIKQGLYQGNLVCDTLRMTNDVIHTTAFAKMLENSYPNYDDTLNKVRRSINQSYAQAFSKNFAIEKMNNRIQMLFQDTPIILYNTEYEKWLWYPGLGATHSFYELMLEKSGAVNLEVY